MPIRLVFNLIRNIQKRALKPPVISKEKYRSAVIPEYRYLSCPLIRLVNCLTGPTLALTAAAKTSFTFTTVPAVPRELPVTIPGTLLALDSNITLKSTTDRLAQISLMFRDFLTFLRLKKSANTKTNRASIPTANIVSPITRSHLNVSIMGC